MAFNSIGNFEFLDLAGRVELLKEETELLRRPGVDGVGLLGTGFRGKPFKLRSRVDVGSLPLAQDLYTGYLGYVFAGAFNVIQFGCNFSAYGVGFLVMDVVPAVVRANLFLMGSLNPPSFAWLEAEWTLVCVALDQTGGDE